MRSILKYLLVLASFALATSSFAADRPNAGGPPDLVEVNVTLLDIDGIDDKTQRFSVDLYFDVRWTDPRLASGDGSRMIELSEIWSPALTIVNDRGLSPMLPDSAEVDSDGNVTVRQRYEGELSVKMNLANFPFDEQLLPIEVVSYRYSQHEIQFSKESSINALAEEFSSGGWHFSSNQPTHQELVVNNVSTGLPMLLFAVSADRDAMYYVLTLVLPMLLVLALAWLVHWVPHGIVPARIGMSTASIFSLMALGISMRLTLPKISYLTNMDVFIILSTLLVLVSLVVAVGCTRLTDSGRDDEAFNLSRRMRIGYPIGFGIIVLISLTL